MPQPLSQLTPIGVPLGVAWVGGVGLAVGVLLWLAGSRFSQALVTLAAVGAGAYLGKKLPGWMHSEIDPIGTCFGAALVLGIVGYVYHRMWVGVGLGLLLAGWTAVLTWHALAPDQAWTCPALVPFDLAAVAKAVWESLPADVRRVMPWAVGGAGVAGVVLGEFVPRFAGRMFYSLLGLSVLGVAGLLVRQTSGWTSRLPAGVGAQVGLAGALVAVGMVVQWWLGPRRAPVAAGPSSSSSSDEESDGSAGE
jgi:hypothetical protein